MTVTTPAAVPVSGTITFGGLTSGQTIAGLLPTGLTVEVVPAGFSFVSGFSTGVNLIPLDADWLKGEIRAITVPDFDVLVKHGFIEVCNDAGEVIASCQQSALPETETYNKRQRHITRDREEVCAETGTATKPKPASGNGPAKLTEAFNTRFWPAWPRCKRKRNPTDALKAWLKLKPDDDLIDTIVASVEQHKESEDWRKSGGDFIPLPASFLRKGGYLDELPDAGHVFGGDPNEEIPF